MPTRAALDMLPGCIGPFASYCSGSGMDPAEPYIVAPLIAFGTAPCQGSPSLSQIVAFDRAEASFANITQTNMVRVSSFNGLNGLLLGFDLLPQVLQPLGVVNGRDDVFCAKPLFQATRSLLGTISDQRFPIAPGQHLLCAYKAHYGLGPCWLYGAMAIAIAEDRPRNADLFLEDHGTLAADPDQAKQIGRVVADLVAAVDQVGQNLAVRYSMVFLSVKTDLVPEGEIGCSLTAAPYLKLAQGAIPPEGASALASMCLPEWEEAVGHCFRTKEFSPVG